MTNKINLDERPREYVSPDCTRDNWVEKVNEHHDRMLDEDKFENTFINQWKSNEPMFPIDDRRNPPVADSALVDAFDCYIDLGFIPPPEILLALNEAFRTYFLGKGKLSIEEVLFGKPKKGLGNYAARRNDEVGSGLYGNLQANRMQRQDVSRSC